MRTLSIAAIATLTLAGPALAASTCSTTHALGDEDRSIMASVQPATHATPTAASRLPDILFSAPDPYGRLSLDDLAQIQSVQPQGHRIILCTTTPTSAR